MPAALPTATTNPRAAIDDETRAAIVELVKARPGLSAGEVAALVGVSAGTAHNVMRAARATALAEQARIAADRATSPEAADVSEPQRLRTLAFKLIGDAEVARSLGDVKTAAALMTQATNVLERLRALEPPPPPDTSTDPLNLAARDAIVARVRELIEREENGRKQLAELEAAVARSGAAPSGTAPPSGMPPP